MNTNDRLLPLPGSNQTGTPVDPSKRMVQMPDGTYAELVVAVNPDGSSVASTVINNFKTVTAALFDATAPGTGWAAGEVLTRLIVTDTSNNSNSVLWLNAVNATITGVIIGTNAEAQPERTTVSVSNLPSTPYADFTRGVGVVDGNTQRVTLSSDGPAMASIGAAADAAASSDTGTFSIIGLIKRGLQNWTSLLARIPALVSGRVPVDGSGVTQPVSGSVSVSNVTGTVSLPTGASTEATLAALNTKMPSQGQALAANSTPVVLPAAQISALAPQLTATPITAQGKIVTTGTAVQLAANALVNGVVIKACDTNAGNLFVGPSTVNNLNSGLGNGYRLTPGEAISFAVNNTNAVWVNGTVGDIFYVAGN